MTRILRVFANSATVEAEDFETALGEQHAAIGSRVASEPAEPTLETQTPQLRPGPVTHRASAGRGVPAPTTKTHVKTHSSRRAPFAACRAKR